MLAGLRPTAAEIVALTDGLGRVLAAPIDARLSHPATDVSSMDGYAVRVADGDAARRVIGTAPAGAPFGGGVGRGEAVRVFTGSVVPAGADAVVAQEDAGRDGGTVRCATPPAGQFIRRCGQDFAAGETLLAAGTRLGARALGLAAAANHPWLAVHRRPTVAILCTGGEVTWPGEALPPGGLPNANGPMLAALVAASGGVPLVLPTASDSADAVAAAVGRAAGAADLLITTGGASVGAHDAVQAGLAAAGCILDFWRIAMQPGRPMLHGRLGALPVLGLPGNPVSAYVCGLLFAAPAIRALAGEPAPRTVLTKARLGAALPANDARADYLRAMLADGLATPFPRQDSAMLRTLALADCLVLRRPHAPPAAAGDAVDVVALTF